MVHLEWSQSSVPTGWWLGDSGSRESEERLDGTGGGLEKVHNQATKRHALEFDAPSRENGSIMKSAIS
jgi:hypothetical protein